MHPPTVFNESTEFTPTLLQRRIMLSFCATALLGIGLCTAYLSGAFQAPMEVVVIAVPDPPAPLSIANSLIPGEENAAPRTNAAKEALPLKLELIATQDAWVEIDTDGQNKYRKLIREEETLSFEASHRIRMMTGNAPGLELRFNGKPVAATGPKRRILTLEFTSEGVLELNSRNS